MEQDLWLWLFNFTGGLEVRENLRPFWYVNDSAILRFSSSIITRMIAICGIHVLPLSFFCFSTRNLLYFPGIQIERREEGDKNGSRRLQNRCAACPSRRPSHYGFGSWVLGYLFGFFFIFKLRIFLMHIMILLF